MAEDGQGGGEQDEDADQDAGGEVPHGYADAFAPPVNMRRTAGRTSHPTRTPTRRDAQCTVILSYLETEVEKAK